MRILNLWLVVWVALKNLLSFLKALPHPYRVIPAIRRASDTAWHYVTEQWRGLSRFQRHVSTNMLIGLAIAIVLNVFHHNPILRDMEDAGIDWAMKLHRGTPYAEVNVPLVFFAIDEESYRKWGEPLLTPRDTLLKLIRLAVDGQAAVVVVDIDVSRPGPDTKKDDALKDYLAGFSKCSDDGKQACAGKKPLIVLMRTFHGPLPSDKQKHLYRSQRPSFLDGVVKQSPYIVWANPAFFREWDGIVRRWLLWEPTCVEQTTLQALPSIQLVVAAHLNGKDQKLQALLARLHSLLPEIRSETCEKPAVPIKSTGPSDEETITLGKWPINLRDDGLRLQQRILYRIPWRLKEGEARATIGFYGQKVDVFSVISADRLIDTVEPVDKNSRALADRIAGRIVVIGNSTQDSRDLYKTPLGEMPGAAILSNAIFSMMEHGQFRPPSLWQKLGIEAVLIVLMSCFFAFFNSFWGMFFSGLSVIVAVIPLSLWMFGEGMWINFAIPLFAVQLHQMAAEFEESVKQRSAQHNE